MADTVKPKTTERSTQCLKRELDNVKQKYGELEAENEQLKNLLRMVLRSKELVLPKEPVKKEHYNELATLNEMYQLIEQALNEDECPYCCKPKRYCNCNY